MHAHGQATVRFLGTRGVPAAHGGFETAAQHIADFLVAQGWRVVVYCQTLGRGPISTDEWNGIERVLIPVPQEGWLGTAVFDLKATRHAARYRDLCVTFGYNTAALNVWHRAKGVPTIFNMDGIEWQRQRWGRFKRLTLRVNERVAIGIADDLIADHPAIEQHLMRYAAPGKIRMIAYGAPSVLDAPVEPVLHFGLIPGRYLSVVCRPVVENSLLEIVEAFSRQPRGHQLVVLGDLREDDPYHVSLREAASSEVVFPGAIYDEPVMAALRFHSRAYVHGHTVGGTNPSLVEALGAGNPVIAHDNVYNRWVAGPDAAFFSSTDELAQLLDTLLHDDERLTRMSRSSRTRHAEEFTWDRIAGEYENLLLEHLPSHMEPPVAPAQPHPGTAATGASPVRAAAGGKSGTVFVHTSDELYGSDRVLLDVLGSLTDEERASAEVWLPTDVPHGVTTLCEEIGRNHPEVTVRHLAVPVLRRAYRSPRKLLGLVVRMLFVLVRLAGRRPERVYCTTSAAFVVAPVARLVGVPQVVGHVQELWSGSDARVLEPLAHGCHRLLAISGPVREALPCSLHDRTSIVVNGTRNRRPDAHVSQRQGPLTFLVASRWNSWKGHRTLLEAWDKAGVPGRLVVLGGPPPSGEAVDVPALVSAMRNAGSVSLVGEVADPGKWIEACDVVLVPSDSPEPFGLVAIEAFACGRPVLGSRGGGLAETVTEGRDGWLFEPGDVDSLVTTLRSLTRCEVATAGEAARKRFEERFTLGRYAEEWRAAVGRPSSGDAAASQLPPEMAG